MAGTLQSIKLAIYYHLIKSSSAGGGSPWVFGFAPRTYTNGNLWAYIPYCCKRGGEREEQSVCKCFCCRVKECIESDQRSSIKLIKNQTLKKNLLKSWHHTFCKGILMQPSSFFPVTVLPIQQEQAPMTAESQIEFPRPEAETEPQSPPPPVAAPRALQLSQPQPVAAGSYHRFGKEYLRTRRALENARPFPRKKKHPTQSCTSKLYSLLNNRISTGFIVSRAEGGIATFNLSHFVQRCPQMEIEPKGPKGYKGSFNLHSQSHCTPLSHAGF